MNKLKLAVGDLKVESFEPAQGRVQFGTVHGNQQTVPRELSSDVQYYPTEPCAATCAYPTCHGQETCGGVTCPDTRCITACQGGGELTKDCYNEQ